MLSVNYKDGMIEEKISEFDSSKEIYLNVGSLKEKKLKLGAIKTSKMPGDESVLIVEAPGAININQKSGLQISIDGKIETFDAVDSVTDIHHGSLSERGTNNFYNYSSRKFVVKTEVIKRMLAAPKSVVRLSVLGSQYIEDTLESPPMYHLISGKEGLTEFYKKVSASN